MPYFLSRLHLQTAVFAADGERLDLVAWLGRQKRSRLSVAVALGVEAQVAAQLLAVRVPAPGGQGRREKIAADAKREGQTPARPMALAD